LAFQHDGKSLPDADAQRGDRDSPATPPQPMRGMSQNPTAGGAERVSDGESTTVDVELLEVEIRPAAQAGERLRCERLVQLDHVDVRPGASALFAALIGAMGKSSGSTPCAARPVMRASGSRSRAPSAPSSTAEAPSLIEDELPAVTLPPSANSARSPASLSTVDSSRMPSSLMSAAPSTCTISSS